MDSSSSLEEEVVVIRNGWTPKKKKIPGRLKTISAGVVEGDGRFDVLSETGGG